MLSVQAAAATLKGLSMPACMLHEFCSQLGARAWFVQGYNAFGSVKVAVHLVQARHPYRTHASAGAVDVSTLNHTRTHTYTHTYTLTHTYTRAHVYAPAPVCLWHIFHTGCGAWSGHAGAAAAQCGQHPGAHQAHAPAGRPADGRECRGTPHLCVCVCARLRAL